MKNRVTENLKGPDKRSGDEKQRGNGERDGAWSPNTDYESKKTDQVRGS